jgi:hypothetical protein
MQGAIPGTVNGVDQWGRRNVLSATFFKSTDGLYVLLGDEHKTVLLSILGTVLSAITIFVITIAISGGVSVTLFKSYVLPLFMSAFTLLIFWGILFARHKGKLPFLQEEPEPPKNEKAPPAQK